MISARIIDMFCGSVGIFSLFFRWESHQGVTAMLPLSLFRNSTVSCAVMANIMSLFFGRLLPSRLVPGCRGCVATDEWSLFPAKNHISSPWLCYQRVPRSVHIQPPLNI